MKTVHFTHDFDYSPDGLNGITYAFYTGHLHELEDSWADAAIAAGAAVLCDAPSLPDDTGEAPSEPSTATAAD